MQDVCSPNLVTCNVMLKAYLAHGMVDEAHELFDKMSEDGNHISRKSDYRVRVIPDIYTFNTMLDACIADKRWDDFENIYRRMLHHGYHFNAKRHLRMILDASRAGKSQKTSNVTSDGDDFPAASASENSEVELVGIVGVVPSSKTKISIFVVIFVEEEEILVFFRQR
uniref:Birch protein n=1 Tax=Betula platyphylla TaxID=78630 RepID=A0A9E9L7M0_BETPL|nr:birch protein [Betula platyphylla]